MTRLVFVLSTNDSALDAKELMESHKIHHLPVLLDGKLVGILSSHDIARVDYLQEYIEDTHEEGAALKALSVHEIMSKEVDYLDSGAKVSDAIMMFRNSSYQSLPVIENERLVGIVTTKDVFRYLSLDI